MAVEESKDQRKHRVDHEYLARVEKAQGRFSRIVGQAIGNYQEVITQASRMLEGALTVAGTVNHAIMVPAQAAYDRQVKLAAEQVAAVVNPAQAQYDQMTADAEASWQRVLTAAQAAYAAEVQASQIARSQSLAEITPSGL